MSSFKCLCFNLGTEEFSVPLLKIKEVIAKPDVTPLPQSASHFLGIINLRGQIISILDLRIKLGIKAQPQAENAVMILDLNGHFVGVVVDRVNSVQLVSQEEISAKPTVDSSKNHDYIDGVFKKNDRLVFMLDVAKSLSIEDKTKIESQKKVA